MMIYKRYIFKQLFSSFVLILGLLLGLFMLIHFSAEIKLFHHPSIGIHHILLYELTYFLNYLDLLCPFALLLAAVKTYTHLTTSRELVALLAAGISKKNILQAPLLAALLVLSSLYLSYQFVIPYAHRWHQNFVSTYLKQPLSQQVLHFTLPDSQTEVIYAEYNPKTYILKDVYWFLQKNDIWHFQSLNLMTQEGFYADHLQRKDRSWHLVESIVKKDNLPIHLSKFARTKHLLPIASQTFSMLGRQAKLSFAKMPNHTAKMTTQFLRRATLPLACLFAIILPAYFCFNASRAYSGYLIFFWSIASGICYFMLVNASCVLGGSQLLSPLLAVSLLPLCTLALASWSYARLQ